MFFNLRGEFVNLFARGRERERVGLEEEKKRERKKEKKRKSKRRRRRKGEKKEKEKDWIFLRERERERGSNTLNHSSASPKPHPSKPRPCNMPQAKTEVALQFSECCAAEVALQHWLFCSADVILTKSCAAASEKLQWNIEKVALQESGAFLQRFPAGFKPPRLGTHVSEEEKEKKKRRRSRSRSRSRRRRRRRRRNKKKWHKYREREEQARSITPGCGCLPRHLSAALQGHPKRAGWWPEGREEVWSECGLRPSTPANPQPPSGPGTPLLATQWCRSQWFATLAPGKIDRE